MIQDIDKTDSVIELEELYTIILTPWWKTWWGIVIIIFSILFLILFIFLFIKLIKSLGSKSRIIDKIKKLALESPNTKDECKKLYEQLTSLIKLNISSIDRSVHTGITDRELLSFIKIKNYNLSVPDKSLFEQMIINSENIKYADAWTMQNNFKNDVNFAVKLLTKLNLVKFNTEKN